MNLALNFDSNKENEEEREACVRSEITSLPSVSQAFSLEKRRFDFHWNPINLENIRREKLQELHLRQNNLYAEHLRNERLIKEGNILERAYYSVREIFTQRELQAARIDVENACIYFVQ